MVYHTGDPPDARMTSAALNRGVKLGGASRPLTPEDLETFDFIVGMVRSRSFFLHIFSKNYSNRSKYTSLSEDMRSQGKTFTFESSTREAYTKQSK